MTSRFEAPADARIGHATNYEAVTGCSVILFDQAVACVADVRGGAPGTRETDLLAPGKLVQRVDAIVLTGGSAFGLRVADGVMAELKERGRGFETPFGSVPIVPAAVIFDLGVGAPIAPTAEMGRAAMRSAVPLDRADWGAIGAGRGATTDKLTGIPLPGGIGYARIDVPGGSVSAVSVTNAVGIVRLDQEASAIQRQLLAAIAPSNPGENTTLVVVMTDLPLDRDALYRLAISAHDGMTRAIVPCHTVSDGDVVFAVALNEVPGSPPISPALSIAAEIAVESSIRNAVIAARVNVR
jgi:L-aminopeptidase/D-esterase-like protein